MNPDEVLRSIEAEAPSKGLPIIGPARGVILDKLVSEHRPTTVLEVGTLVGYSAIRIAKNLKQGGKLICVEVRDDMADLARSNVEKAGLSSRVEVVLGDAKMVLPTLSGPFDMVFLDAVKEDYLHYLTSIEGKLHKGSVVVADNVKSFGDAMADYLDHVRNSGAYRSSYHEFPSNYGTDPGDAVEISVKL